MHQLFLFKENSNVNLQAEIDILKEKCEKLRKAQFAKIGELTKMYLETKYELEMLKQALCKTSYI